VISVIRIVEFALLAFISIACSIAMLLKAKARHEEFSFLTARVVVSAVIAINLR